MLFAIAAVFMMVAVSQPASAQSRYDFKAPFDFVAHGKPCPAGDYTLVANDTDEVLTLEAKDPQGGNVALMVETRLAERKALADPEVVFDKVNGQLILSELLVPGLDGYLVAVTKAKHTHESVKGSRAKK
jgi:hypothetical protein